MVTIKDVAKLANCSPTTISFILNDHPLAKSIPESTKLRVNEAIRELGYVPNAYAKMLRKGGVHSIGILCFDIQEPYTTNVLYGITQYLNETNFFYHLMDVGDNLELLNRFIRTSKSYNIESYIIIANTLPFDTAHLLPLLEKDIYLVSIAQTIPNYDVPTILVDNHAGIRMALKHLLDLGHRDIAFVYGPSQLVDARLRRQSIQELCQELGVPLHQDLTVEMTNCPPTNEHGAQAIRRIIDHKTPFTAVMAFNDYTAFGVVQELIRAGLRVPQDVSVVGFDDILFAKAFNPALTTVKQPMLEMGVQSAKKVVASLSAKGKKRTKSASNGNLVLQPELIIRESTARASR